METTSLSTAERISAHYRTYLLEHGRPPASVYALTQQIDLPETEFYDHFHGLEAVEQAIWQDLFKQARRQAEAQEVYAQYSVREKLLAFYYTLVEILKGQRSFVQVSLQRMQPGRFEPLITAREAFKDYARELVSEGVATREILNRPLLTSRYADGLWLQTKLLLSFWRKDRSPGFEETDAFIEKTVNASLDLMGRTPTDSLLDLGKFLWQRR